MSIPADSSLPAAAAGGLEGSSVRAGGGESGPEGDPQTNFQPRFLETTTAAKTRTKEGKNVVGTGVTL